MIELSRPGLRRCLPLLWLLLGVGCSRPQITSYEAPKELATERQATPGTNANDQFAPVPRARVTWKTPPGWTELPGDQMRVAAFSVRGEKGAQAEVTVIPLPSLGETDLQNVNRWRGQLKLTPIAETGLAESRGELTIDRAPAKFFDIGAPGVGAGTTRILVAQQRRADVEWYVKMTGDDALVQTQRAAFLQFAQSLSFEESAP